MKHLSISFLAGLLCVAISEIGSAQNIFIQEVWVSNINSCATVSGKSNVSVCRGAGSADWNQNSPVPAGDPNCTGSAGPAQVGCGDISNNPHIIASNSLQPFNANSPIVQACVDRTSPPKVEGSLPANFCNSQVMLCATVGFNNPIPPAGVNNSFSVDSLSFDVIAFSPASNPLDPAATPSLTSMPSIANLGVVPSGPTDPGNYNFPSASDCRDAGLGGAGCGYCVPWDGSSGIPLGGGNGKFGFRATVATNLTGESGNMLLANTLNYPSQYARDSSQKQVMQQPITIDPVLAVQPASNGVTLSWPASVGTNYVLQQTMQLPLGWAPVTNSVIQDSNNQNTVTVPVNQPAGYFRLTSAP